MFLSVIPIIIFGGISPAHDFYRCDRVAASTQALKKGLQLDQVFPKETKFVIAENKSWLASQWGIQRGRSKNERLYNIANFKSGFKFLGSDLASKSEVTIQFGRAGYKSALPARYVCDNPLKNEWEPEEE